MNSKGADAFLPSGWRSQRPFLQPVAVICAFCVFAALFFVMGRLDLKRTEGLLMEALRTKAHYVAELIEKSAVEKYRRFTEIGEAGILAWGPPSGEEAFGLYESLADSLLHLAREIDEEDRTKPRFRDTLPELAASENLKDIVFLEDPGNVALEAAFLPPGILPRMRALAEGKGTIAVHLLEAIGGKAADGAVGIARQDDKGAVVLVLDTRGLQFWVWRIAIRSALEEEAQPTGDVVYFHVENADGKTLVRAGSLSELELRDCRPGSGEPERPPPFDGRCLQAGDTRFLGMSFPFHEDGKVIGTTRIGIETRGTDLLLAKNRRHIVLWTGVMVLIGFVAMAILYLTQNRHIGRLQAMQDQLRRAERLSSLGTLAAGVAHEIRNPLNAISIAAQRLQREFSPTGAKEAEEFNRISLVIRDEVRRLNSIVEDFLSLPQSSRMELKDQPLEPLLERVLFLTRAEAGFRRVTVEKNWGTPLPRVSMHAGKMEQALLNVLRNAVEAVSESGAVTLSCRELGKSWVSICIEDTGPGIDASRQGQIFDPFFTTKDKGTGLGLAVTREIVLAHGGEIRAGSVSGKGTTFEILLPRQEEGKA